MTFAAWASMTVGGALVLAGVLAWRHARGRARSQDFRRQGAPGPVTLNVVGLCCVLVGYHMVAYPLPAAWFPLKIPLDRAWIMGVGVVLAVAGSLLADHLDACEGPQG